MSDQSAQEIRFLVDTYYQWQEDRKRANLQALAASKDGEEPDRLKWLTDRTHALELEVALRVSDFVNAHPMGDWLKSVHGIGPILAGGLLAHIDIEKAPTVGHIYQFAGWAADGQKPWLKGTVRPFNAKFRTLCWKIGQSFMKAGGYYGDIYRERKAYEQQKNEAGDYKQQAAVQLMKNKFGKDTMAYKAYTAGQLPAAHIDARARRYAVKLFLAHLHGEWYQRHYGKPPPLPYPIAILGHAHLKQPFSNLI